MMKQMMIVEFQTNIYSNSGWSKHHSLLSAIQSLHYKVLLCNMTIYVYLFMFTMYVCRKLGLLTKIYNYFLDKGQYEQGAVEIFHCDLPTFATTVFHAAGVDVDNLGSL